MSYPAVPPAGSTPGSGYPASGYPAATGQWTAEQAQAYAWQQIPWIQSRVQPLVDAAQAYREFARTTQEVIDKGSAHVKDDLASWAGDGRDSFVRKWARNFSGDDTQLYAGLPAHQMLQLSRLHDADNPPTQMLLTLRDGSNDAADQMESLANAVGVMLFTEMILQIIDVVLTVAMVLVPIAGVFGKVCEAIFMKGIEELSVQAAKEMALQFVKTTFTSALKGLVDVAAKKMALQVVKGAAIGAGIDLSFQLINENLSSHIHNAMMGLDPPPLQANINWLEVGESAGVGAVTEALTRGAMPKISALTKDSEFWQSGPGQRAINAALAIGTGVTTDAALQGVNIWLGPQKTWNWEETTQNAAIGALTGFHPPHPPAPDAFTVRQDNPGGESSTWHFTQHGNTLKVIDPDTGRQIGTGHWTDGAIDIDFKDGGSQQITLAGTHVERLSHGTQTVQVANPKTGGLTDVEEPTKILTTYMVDGGGHQHFERQATYYSNGTAEVRDENGVFQTQHRLDHSITVDRSTGKIITYDGKSGTLDEGGRHATVDPTVLDLPEGSVVTMNDQSVVTSVLSPTGPHAVDLYALGSDGHLDRVGTLRHNGDGLVTMTDDPGHRTTVATKDSEYSAATTPADRTGHGVPTSEYEVPIGGEKGTMSERPAGPLFTVHKGEVTPVVPTTREQAQSTPVSELPPGEHAEPSPSAVPGRGAGAPHVTPELAATQALNSVLGAVHPDWMAGAVEAISNVSSGGRETFLMTAPGIKDPIMVTVTRDATVTTLTLDSEGLAATIDRGRLGTGIANSLGQIADTTGTSFRAEIPGGQTGPHEFGIHPGGEQTYALHQILSSILPAVNGGGAPVRTTVDLGDGTRVSFTPRLIRDPGRRETVRLTELHVEDGTVPENQAVNRMRSLVTDLGDKLGRRVDVTHGEGPGVRGENLLFTHLPDLPVRTGPIVEPEGAELFAPVESGRPPVMPDPVRQPSSVPELGRGEVAEYVAAAYQTGGEIQRFTFPIEHEGATALIDVTGDIDVSTGQVTLRLAPGENVDVLGGPTPREVVVAQTEEALRGIAERLPGALTVHNGELDVLLNPPEVASTPGEGGVYGMRVEDMRAIHAAAVLPNGDKKVTVNVPPDVTTDNAAYTIGWTTRYVLGEGGEARLVLHEPMVEKTLPDGTRTYGPPSETERSDVLSPITKLLEQVSGRPVDVTGADHERVQPEAVKTAEVEASAGKHGQAVQKIAESLDETPVEIPLPARKVEPNAEIEAAHHDRLQEIEQRAVEQNTEAGEVKLLPAPRFRDKVAEIPGLDQVLKLFGKKDGAGFSDITLHEIFGPDNPTGVKRIVDAVLKNPFVTVAKPKEPVPPKPPAQPDVPEDRAPKRWEKYRQAEEIYQKYRLPRYDKEMADYPAKLRAYDDLNAANIRLVRKASAFALRYARQTGLPLDQTKFGNLYEYYGALFTEFTRHPDWFGHVDAEGRPMAPLERTDSAALVAYGRKFDDIISERFQFEFAQASAKPNNYVPQGFLNELAVADFDDPIIRQRLAQEIHAKLIGIAEDINFGNPAAAAYHPHKHAPGLVPTPNRRNFPADSYMHSAGESLRTGHVATVERMRNGSVMVELHATVPHADGEGSVKTKSILFVEARTGRMVLATHQAERDASTAVPLDPDTIVAKATSADADVAQAIKRADESAAQAIQEAGDASAPDLEPTSHKASEPLLAKAEDLQGEAGAGEAPETEKTDGSGPLGSPPAEPPEGGPPRPSGSGEPKPGALTEPLRDPAERLYDAAVNKLGAELPAAGHTTAVYSERGVPADQVANNAARFLERIGTAFGRGSRTFREFSGADLHMATPRGDLNGRGVHGPFEELFGRLELSGRMRTLRGLVKGADRIAAIYREVHQEHTRLVMAVERAQHAGIIDTDALERARRTAATTHDVLDRLRTAGGTAEETSRALRRLHDDLEHALGSATGGGGPDAARLIEALRQTHRLTEDLGQAGQDTLSADDVGRTVRQAYDIVHPTLDAVDNTGTVAEHTARLQEILARAEKHLPALERRLTAMEAVSHVARASRYGQEAGRLHGEVQRVRERNPALERARAVLEYAKSFDTAENAAVEQLRDAWRQVAEGGGPQVLSRKQAEVISRTKLGRAHRSGLVARAEEWWDEQPADYREAVENGIGDAMRAGGFAQPDIDTVRRRLPLHEYRQAHPEVRLTPAEQIAASIQAVKLELKELRATSPVLDREQRLEDIRSTHALEQRLDRLRTDERALDRRVAAESVYFTQHTKRWQVAGTLDGLEQALDRVDLAFRSASSLLGGSAFDRETVTKVHELLANAAAETGRLRDTTDLINIGGNHRGGARTVDATLSYGREFANRLGRTIGEKIQPAIEDWLAAHHDGDSALARRTREDLDHLIVRANKELSDYIVLREDHAAKLDTSLAENASADVTAITRALGEPSTTGHAVWDVSTARNQVDRLPAADRFSGTRAIDTHVATERSMREVLTAGKRVRDGLSGPGDHDVALRRLHEAARLSHEIRAMVENEWPKRFGVWADEQAGGPNSTVAHAAGRRLDALSFDLEKKIARLDKIRDALHDDARYGVEQSIEDARRQTAMVDDDATVAAADLNDALDALTGRLDTTGAIGRMPVRTHVALIELREIANDATSNADRLTAMTHGLRRLAEGYVVDGGRRSNGLLGVATDRIPAFAMDAIGHAEMASLRSYQATEALDTVTRRLDAALDAIHDAETAPPDRQQAAWRQVDAAIAEVREATGRLDKAVMPGGSAAGAAYGRRAGAITRALSGRADLTSAYTRVINAADRLTLPADLSPDWIHRAAERPGAYDDDGSAPADVLNRLNATPGYGRTIADLRTQARQAADLRIRTMAGQPSSPHFDPAKLAEQGDPDAEIVSERYLPPGVTRLHGWVAPTKENFGTHWANRLVTDPVGVLKAITAASRREVEPLSVVERVITYQGETYLTRTTVQNVKEDRGSLLFPYGRDTAEDKLVWSSGPHLDANGRLHMPGPDETNDSFTWHIVPGRAELAFSPLKYRLRYTTYTPQESHRWTETVTETTRMPREGTVYDASAATWRTIYKGEASYEHTLRMGAEVKQMLRSYAELKVYLLPRPGRGLTFLPDAPQIAVRLALEKTLTSGPPLDQLRAVRSVRDLLDYLRVGREKDKLESELYFSVRVPLLGEDVVGLPGVGSYIADFAQLRGFQFWWNWKDYGGLHQSVAHLLERTHANVPLLNRLHLPERPGPGRAPRALPLNPPESLARVQRWLIDPKQAAIDSAERPYLFPDRQVAGSAGAAQAAFNRTIDELHTGIGAVRDLVTGGRPGPISVEASALTPKIVRQTAEVARAALADGAIDEAWATRMRRLAGQAEAIGEQLQGWHAPGARTPLHKELGEVLDQLDGLVSVKDPRGSALQRLIKPAEQGTRLSPAPTSPPGSPERAQVFGPIQKVLDQVSGKPVEVTGADPTRVSAETAKAADANAEVVQMVKHADENADQVTKRADENAAQVIGEADKALAQVLAPLSRDESPPATLDKAQPPTVLDQPVLGRQHGGGLRHAPVKPDADAQKTPRLGKLRLGPIASAHSLPGEAMGMDGRVYRPRPAEQIPAQAEAQPQVHARPEHTPQVHARPEERPQAQSMPGEKTEPAALDTGASRTGDGGHPPVADLSARIEQQRRQLQNLSDRLSELQVLPIKRIRDALDLRRRMTETYKMHLDDAQGKLDDFRTKARAAPYAGPLGWAEAILKRRNSLNRLTSQAMGQIRDVFVLERIVDRAKQEVTLSPEQTAAVDDLFRDFKADTDLSDAQRRTAGDMRQSVIDALKVDEYMSTHGLKRLVKGEAGELRVDDSIPVPWAERPVRKVQAQIAALEDDLRRARDTGDTSKTAVLETKIRKKLTRLDTLVKRAHNERVNMKIHELMTQSREAGIDEYRIGRTTELPKVEQRVRDLRAQIGAIENDRRAAQGNEAKVARLTARHQEKVTELDTALAERERLDRADRRYFQHRPEFLSVERAIAKSRLTGLTRALDEAFRRGDQTMAASLMDDIARADDRLRWIETRLDIRDLRSHIDAVSARLDEARSSGDTDAVTGLETRLRELDRTLESLVNTPREVRAVEDAASRLASVDAKVHEAETGHAAAYEAALNTGDATRAYELKHELQGRRDALNILREQRLHRLVTKLSKLGDEGAVPLDADLLRKAAAGDETALGTLLEQVRRAADPASIMRGAGIGGPYEVPRPSGERRTKRAPEDLLSEEEHARPDITYVREVIEDRPVLESRWAGDIAKATDVLAEDHYEPVETESMNLGWQQTQRKAYVQVLDRLLREEERLAELTGTEPVGSPALRAQTEKVVGLRTMLDNWTEKGADAQPEHTTYGGLELSSSYAAETMRIHKGFFRKYVSDGSGDPRKWKDVTETPLDVPVKTMVHSTHREVIKDWLTGKQPWPDIVGGRLPVDTKTLESRSRIVTPDGVELEVTVHRHSSLIIDSGLVTEGGLSMLRIDGGLGSGILPFWHMTPWAFAVELGPLTVKFALPIGPNFDLQYIPGLRRDFYSYDQVGHETISVKKLADPNGSGLPDSWTYETPAIALKPADDVLRTEQFYTKWGIQLATFPLIQFAPTIPGMDPMLRPVFLQTGMVALGQLTGEFSIFVDPQTGRPMKLDWGMGLEYLVGNFFSLPEAIGDLRFEPNMKRLFGWGTSPGTVGWNRVETFNLARYIERFGGWLMERKPLKGMFEKRLAAQVQQARAEQEAATAEQDRVRDLLDGLMGSSHSGVVPSPGEPGSGETYDVAGGTNAPRRGPNYTRSLSEDMLVHDEHGNLAYSLLTGHLDEDGAS